MIYRPKSVSVPALVLLAGLAFAACGDDAPTGPTEQPPTEVTETFSGSLSVNGAVTHPFTVGRAGNAIATLTTLAPDSTSVIGLSLGTWNGVSCQIIIAADTATQGTSVVGTASAGTFCARVYDVSRITQPVEYGITVRHF